MKNNIVIPNLSVIPAKAGIQNRRGLIHQTQGRDKSRPYSKRGITLIELLVSITIITILSTVSFFGIVEFQKNAVLDSTAEELASTIESARSMSVSGLAIEGTTASDYEPDYLPVYGVKVESDKYSLFRTYRNDGDASDTTDILDTANISSNSNFTVTGEVVFSRRNGQESGATSFTLTRTGSTVGRRIDIGNQVVITKL